MKVDLSNIGPSQTNEAIELLCKSVEDSLIWNDHPTDRLLNAVERSTEKAVSDPIHILHVAMQQLFKPLLRKAKGDEDEKGHCRELDQRIRSAPAGSLSMTDYLDIIDCLMQRYMPVDFLANRVKRQSVKQYMAGYIRHDVKDLASITAGKADTMVNMLPETITEAKRIYQISSIDEARIRVAQASGSRLVSTLAASTRSAMQKIIVDAEKSRINRQGPVYDVHSLQQSLSDNFATLNLDWRRIAVTETAINAADGFLMACAVGEVLRWASHPGACQYCQSQNGLLFTVVSASAPHKDPATQVWPGKHLMNIGRSIAKMKRTENGMEPRTDDERLVPAIPAHPVCQCSWVKHVELTDDQKKRIGRA
ncbi:MAG: hypothetical protein Q7U76_12870 [Nitrospirota bacterium]|nr:hypothetical protein [Nitrospirota bacterium]